MPVELPGARFGDVAPPGPGYGITIRVVTVPSVTATGVLAAAVAESGAVLTALDVVEAVSGTMTVDVSCDTLDAEHMRRVVAHIGRLPGVEVRSVSDRTFLSHLGGKLSVEAKAPIRHRDDLARVYTPGVARVAEALAANPDDGYNLTIKRNTVAVVTDGSAVLGLGNIGPEAALPVMEGKALLFKRFAGIDAWPVCLDTQDVDEIVRIVQVLAPVYGGINLEDIAAPRCFTVEEELKRRLDIPVMHDDQHGTAVAVLAALINATKVVGKRLPDLSVVVAGVGAAGVACTRMLLAAGVRDIVGCDRGGAVYRGRVEDMNPVKEWYAAHTNPEGKRGSLREVLAGADVFLGLSTGGLLRARDLAVMAKDPIVFAMANPLPEVRPEEAAAVRVFATGRSDYPNQINNVLCFPGLFRGLLDCGAQRVTDRMKLAAAHAIAALAAESGLHPEHVVPSVLNREVAPAVAAAVRAAARPEASPASV